MQPDFVKRAAMSMTDEEIQSMSLNPYDQLFIKRCQDRTEDYLAEVLANHYKRVFDLIAEQNLAISETRDAMIKINDRIDVIEHRLDDDNVRIALLERYASFQNTMMRMIMAAAVGISIAIVIFYNLHAKIQHIL